MTRSNNSGPTAPYAEIGSGGMATIFAAVDGVIHQRVAIKRLHPHIASRPGATERFLREGRAAARIRHPHVVQIFALGTSEGAPYLAMELLEGSDLGTVLTREGRLGVEDALEIVLPVIAGVAAAHDAGVVHRDLKPSNVFVSSGPRGRVWPKVLDFGVSKILDAEGDGPATATDGVIGTAAYMAPEQARTARSASFRSDQYSLGVLLYQCLTGELPFATAGMYDLVVAIMTAPNRAAQPTRRRHSRGARRGRAPCDEPRPRGALSLDAGARRCSPAVRARAGPAGLGGGDARVAGERTAARERSGR